MGFISNRMDRMRLRQPGITKAVQDYAVIANQRVEDAANLILDYGVGLTAIAVEPIVMKAVTAVKVTVAGWDVEARRIDAMIEARNKVAAYKTINGNQQ